MKFSAPLRLPIIAILSVSILLLTLSPVHLAFAEVQVELNGKLACCVDESLEKNTTLINSKTLKEISIAKLIKRTKKKAKRPTLPTPKRKKLRALLRKLKQCKNQKGDYNPEEVVPPKTGSAFAKANLITEGTSIAAKCTFVAPDSDAQLRAVTGASIYCSLGALVTASSGTFFLFGEGQEFSQSLSNTLFIPTNGQFNTFSTTVDAETAQTAVDYLRGSKTNLSGTLRYATNGQTFDLYGLFEEASGEGNCQIQASIIGQGNSGQIFLDLADGSVSVTLGNEVSSLTTLNIFAGNSTNSPTVEQFAIPQSIIDVLPQDEFAFSLSTEQLAQVINAVTNVSETLTVSIPQSPVDNTLVGTFTTPQLDCPAAQGSS